MTPKLAMIQKVPRTKLMKLDPSAEEHVRKRLAKDCPDLKCPACGGKDHEIGGMSVTFLAPAHKKGPIKFTIPANGTSDIAPFIAVVCRACACSLFFSAVQLGLVPSQE
jgi:hypothetical protein